MRHGHETGRQTKGQIAALLHGPLWADRHNDYCENNFGIVFLTH